LNNLAAVYFRQNDNRKPEPLYREALEIHQRLLGPDHLYVAADLNNLGTLYAARHRPAEAAEFLLRALAIREKYPDTAKGERLINLSNLAELYLSQKNLELAERYYAQMVPLLKAQTEIDSTTVAQSIENYATLLRKREEFAEAERLATEAMRIRVRHALRQ
jgi:kinesin light chain